MSIIDRDFMAQPLEMENSSDLLKLPTRSQPINRSKYHCEALFKDLNTVHMNTFHSVLIYIDLYLIKKSAFYNNKCRSRVWCAAKKTPTTSSHFHIDWWSNAKALFSLNSLLNSTRKLNLGSLGILYSFLNSFWIFWLGGTLEEPA